MRFSVLPFFLLLSWFGLQAQTPCEIYDLTVVTGVCNPNAPTYVATINFQVQNPTNDSFIVWGNNQPLGSYPLSALPFTINSFPYNGGASDVVKVCMKGNEQCCRTQEFPVPACILTTPCEIFNMVVTPGDCTGDSTYTVVLNFQVANSSSTNFTVFGNGVLLGNYPLSTLPLTIQNFHYNGGPNDVIQVCMSQNLTCCKTVEFPVPPCILNSGTCEIVNFVYDTGECTSDSTYNIVVNFQVANSTANHFNVYGNGVLIGNYALSALPLTIHNFHYNGGANDVIQVCMVLPNTSTTCCKTVEFPVPACILNSGNCEIYNLTVATGDCTSDSTYNVVVNFLVANSTANHFAIWGNGVLIGDYALSELPLTIYNFHYDGGNNDVIKVCMVQSGVLTCCKTLEFPVPACILNNGNCEIYNLFVETGECHEDSTYTVVINFQVANPTNDFFEVWGNGVYLGYYPLNALPLTLLHFPYNGGPNDVVKVCMNDNPNCCRVIEFPVPACTQEGNCHIWDLNVKTTPCLCGQFFAVLTFNYENTGNGGFDVVGNGVNYGTYLYAHSQPVIIGPLEGNGTTQYEFGVQDHFHPDCHDGYELGIIDCPETPAVEVPFVAGTLSISPNPASEWLTVSAQLTGGQVIGSGDVTIRSADGRTVKTVNVANSSSFSINISDLPATNYHLMLETSAGRMQNTFIKL